MKIFFLLGLLTIATYKEAWCTTLMAPLERFRALTMGSSFVYTFFSSGMFANKDPFLADKERAKEAEQKARDLEEQGRYREAASAYEDAANIFKKAGSTRDEERCRQRASFLRIPVEILQTFYLFRFFPYPNFVDSAGCPNRLQEQAAALFKISHQTSGEKLAECSWRVGQMLIQCCCKGEFLHPELLRVADKCLAFNEAERPTLPEILSALMKVNDKVDTHGYTELAKLVRTTETELRQFVHHPQSPSLAEVPRKAAERMQEVNRRLQEIENGWSGRTESSWRLGLLQTILGQHRIPIETSSSTDFPTWVNMQRQNPAHQTCVMHSLAYLLACYHRSRSVTDFQKWLHTQYHVAFEPLQNPNRPCGVVERIPLQGISQEWKLAQDAVPSVRTSAVLVFVPICTSHHKVPFRTHRGEHRKNQPKAASNEFNLELPLYMLCRDEDPKVYCPFGHRVKPVWHAMALIGELNWQGGQWLLLRDPFEPENPKVIPLVVGRHWPACILTHLENLVSNPDLSMAPVQFDADDLEDPDCQPDNAAGPQPDTNIEGEDDQNEFSIPISERIAFAYPESTEAEPKPAELHVCPCLADIVRMPPPLPPGALRDSPPKRSKTGDPAFFLFARPPEDKFSP